MNRIVAIVWTVMFLGVSQVVGQDEGWVELFNGQSLDGWTPRGGAAKYTVEERQIVGTSVPNTPNSFLCTEGDYGDFLLEFEVLLDAELNSGVQIRSLSSPDFQQGRVHGYQVELDGSERGWTGGLYDESGRGWLSDLARNDRGRYAFKHGDWNRIRVEAMGDHFRTWVNGVAAARLVDAQVARGFIGLQVHGVGGRTNPLTVRWRNLRIRPLTEGESAERLAAEPAEVDVGADAGEGGELVVEGASFTRLPGEYAFTEGPAVGPDGRVYFSDIPKSRIHAADVTSGQIEIFREPSGGANGLYWTPNDVLVACEMKARRVTWQRPGSDPIVLVETFEGKRLNSPNDLVLDGGGGFYFTDPRYGDRGDMEMEVEGVYYVSRERQVTRVIDNLVRPNGLILSLDNRVLYVADAEAGKIWAYDVESPGKLARPRVFAEVGSDGMTIDHRGNVYCTWNGAVHIFAPDGTALQTLEVPESPANITFCGPDSKTLFVTARTGVYTLPMNVSGGRAFANPQ